MQSLWEAYKDFFPIGAAVNAETVKTHEELLIKHFNSLTAENEMKFSSLHPQDGVYEFKDADLIHDFAKRHNMKLRGHTFVWHNQTPEWVFKNEDGTSVSRDLLLERLKAHVHDVVKRYGNDVYCWDVVNEAVEDKTAQYLRDTKWLEIIGESYIQKAFEIVNQAAPEAMLFYNDYNECVPEKREKIYKLVRTLKENGVPIHGIGLQCHWNIFNPSFDEIQRSLEKYASLGLKIQITEMDISVFTFEDQRRDLTEPTAEMIEKQASLYAKAFKLFREYKDVINGVTLWGVADDKTWLDDFPVRGRKNWPLLFDVEHNPKEAFYRIVQF